MPYSLKLIANFLKQRSQCVVVDVKHSTWTHVKNGVAPGPVLGSLIFLLHINYLPKSSYHM